MQKDNEPECLNALFSLLALLSPTGVSHQSVGDGVGSLLFDGFVVGKFPLKSKLEAAVAVVPTLIPVVAVDVAVTVAAVVAAVAPPFVLGAPVELGSDTPMGLIEGVFVAALFGDPVGVEDDISIELLEGTPVSSLVGERVGFSVDTPRGLFDGITISALIGDPVGLDDCGAVEIGLAVDSTVTDSVTVAGVVSAPISNPVGLDDCDTDEIGRGVGSTFTDSTLATVAVVASLVEHTGSGPHFVMDSQLHRSIPTSKINPSLQLSIPIVSPLTHCANFAQLVLGI